MKPQIESHVIESQISSSLAIIMQLQTATLHLLLVLLFPCFCIGAHIDSIVNTRDPVLMDRVTLIGVSNSSLNYYMLVCFLFCLLFYSAIIIRKLNILNVPILLSCYYSCEQSVSLCVGLFVCVDLSLYCKAVQHYIVMQHIERHAWYLL